MKKCIPLALLLLLFLTPFQASAASIRLNITKVSLMAGDSFTLTATVSGSSGKVKWTTSNKAVAVVTQKGKVTGKKAGTATISATANGKTAKCKVTVTSKGKSNSVFAGGNGTKSSPYKVSTFEQLKAIGKYNTCYFKQTANINAGGARLSPLFTSKKPFKGHYNGNGKTISNLVLTTNKNSAEWYSLNGLFGEIHSKGVVSNLKLKNITLSDTLFETNSDTTYMGAVAGTNYGTITGIKANNITVKNNDTNRVNGGICGGNYGTVKNCTVTNYRATQHQSIKGGGIAGYNKGIIQGCKTGNTVISATAAGCIVGDNYTGKVISCKVYAEASFPQCLMWGYICGESVMGSTSGCDTFLNKYLTK